MKSLGAEIILLSIFDLPLSEGLLSFFLDPKKLNPEDVEASDAFDALEALVSARAKDGDDEPPAAVVEVRADAAGDGAPMEGRREPPPGPC